MGRLAWISIAPVKGLALVDVPEARLDATGVRENRRFFLVDGDGRMLNGKRFGQLTTVAPVWDEDERRLELRFPDGSVVAGKVETNGPLTALFYGRPVSGRTVVGPWSDALTRWAGKPIRLVQAPVGKGTDRGAGVTLLSTASLEALGAAAGVSAPVDGRRFRMLLGIDEVGPHEEDSWLDRRVRIGGAVVIPRGNVGRCAVTTINPDTGLSDLDTLGALKSYRDEVPTSERLPFGVWGDVAEPGLVRVGDVVEPLPDR